MNLKVKLNDKMTVGVILVLIALFSFMFLGFVGFKVLFGMILVFFLPFYLILDNFNLTRGEKIIFSFFIGLGVFPSIVYWLAIFILFKLSIVITFVILMVAVFICRNTTILKNGGLLRKP
jgi:apolipoprotein N-acyltransferase